MSFPRHLTSSVSQYERLNGIQEKIYWLLDRDIQSTLADSFRHRTAFPVGDFTEWYGLNVKSFFPCKHTVNNLCFIPIFGFAEQNEARMKLAYETNTPIALCEDSFLRAATVYGDTTVPSVYRQSVSLTCDSHGFYFDASRPSDIERLISSIELSDQDRQVARDIMGGIVSRKISKYNNQPILSNPRIGSVHKDKILIIDQDNGDLSTFLGSASEHHFNEMLQAAVDENPGCDIIVKTHPDSLVANGKKGYYSKVKENDRVYKITYPINPYSIIEAVKKVYVATSTFGFEALMAGKDVSVFGIPWYSGWGITDDRQTCTRRNQKRSLEDLFHAFYIQYTHYANPFTNTPCSIQEAIDAICKMRNAMSDPN